MYEDRDPDGIYGVCNVCRERVLNRDIWSHPCPRYYVDTSWNSLVNPRNVEWEPGYRFNVAQDSQRQGRVSGKMRARVYAVGFEIGRDGVLRWDKRGGGGIKPTEMTMANVKATYEHHRPHLPLSREELQHLVDSWEHANDPTSVAIATKARAMLEGLD